MRAAVLAAVGQVCDLPSSGPLAIEEIPTPEVKPGYLLLRVKACGVCRTDLHVVEGELPPLHSHIVPGHQIVGEVIGGQMVAGAQLPLGSRVPLGSGQALGSGMALGARVGVSWLGGTDGTCPYCRRGEENLCDAPVYTGYSVNGGYAEYALARADFTVPLPGVLDDLAIAPLLCAGIIGFRSLRVAGVEQGERVGLFGFGASAHLALPVLKAWNCEVFVSTRGESHRKLARELGANWVGEEHDRPPVTLDRAVTFAPSGDVVIAALASLRKGGVVAVNAIHLDRIPEFDYDSLLWGERQIRSVANMTRADARDFLSLAAEIKLRPRVTVFSLDQANDALLAVKNGAIDGAAVIVP